MTPLFDHFNRADCELHNIKVLAGLLYEQIADIHVDDRIDRDKLDALATLATTIQDKLDVADEAVTEMWKAGKVTPAG